MFIYIAVANNTYIMQHGEFFSLNNITFITKHFYNIWLIESKKDC